MTASRGATRLLIVFAVATLLAACSSEIPFIPTPEPTPEQPREVVIETARDPSSANHLAGVTIQAGDQVGVTDAAGQLTMTLMRGTKVEATLAGHDPARGEVPAEGPLRLELRDNVAHGTVTDQAGEAIAGVRVFVDGGDGSLAETDRRGAYELPGVPPDATLVFKMPGYRLHEQATGADLAIDVGLEPFEARALYAPAAIFEGAGRLDELLALLDRTEANAMVIDVKETDGRLYYATQLETAAEVGAIREAPIFDLAKLLPMLKERGIYTIARVVSMKDNTSAAARPELAVRNSATGEPWRDNIGGAWLDPSAPGVAEYLASIAGDLAAKGFDEVQLDYIRFFSDGPYDVADTNLPNTQSFRLPAIQRVLRVVSAELDATHTFLGADVFPIAFIVPDDQGIGQRPEVIMPFVDYFCPMVYPSHYGPGVFGFPVPNDHPYEVIDNTLQIMSRQAAGLPVVIRPWIQDFGYGSFAPYTADQVLSEFAAAADNGARGWMIWNARAIFTEAALGPPRAGEDSAPTTAAAPPAAAEASAAPSAVP